MINVLIIHQSADLYGSDKTLLMFLEHYDREEFFALVLLPNDGPLRTALESIGILVEIVPVMKIYRNIFTPLNLLKFGQDGIAGFKTLNELHKKHKFKIVYSNTLAVLLGVLFSSIKNIKHVWHVHEIIVHPKIFAKLFPRLLQKFANVVICNSFATQENLLTVIPSLAKKTIVVQNGVENKNKTTFAKTKADFGYTSEDVIITLVGRISRLKGHKWVLNTIINHGSAWQNLKLLIVGSPIVGQENYLHEIQHIISARTLDKRVKIIGYCSNLAEIWNVTDIALMPSTEAESFGLVAAEAMLAQKPVIGSNLGGLKEIIMHNQTGFLVEPNDEKSLAKAIGLLYENKELREQFGQNGQVRVIQNFSVNNYISGIERALKS